jgi:hypothetical protein
MKNIKIFRKTKNSHTAFNKKINVIDPEKPMGNIKSKLGHAKGHIIGVDGKNGLIDFGTLYA